MREEKCRQLRVARGGRDGRKNLSLDEVLKAADAYRMAAGRWPTVRSGVIPELPGETWGTIQRALVLGLRGLPGGTSVATILAQHRGRRGNGLVALTVDAILGWADAYHAAHGRWPDATSGPVDEAPSDTWFNLDKVLGRGGRGLPGGSSLKRILAEHRGVRYSRMEPDLTPAQITAWSEAHHAATGRWPLESSGPVVDAPGEVWRNIDHALRIGRRGLPGGSSLARLLADHTRGSRRPLTVETILAWGEAHHAVHGRWPGPKSGAVLGAPGEKWPNIDQALRSGNRNLPGGLSVSKLFACHPAPGAIVPSPVRA
jgi:hypothetical protein